MPPQHYHDINHTISNIHLSLLHSRYLESLFTLLSKLHYLLVPTSILIYHQVYIFNLNMLRLSNHYCHWLHIYSCFHFHLPRICSRSLGLRCCSIRRRHQFRLGIRVKYHGQQGSNRRFFLILYFSFYNISQCPNLRKLHHAFLLFLHICIKVMLILRFHHQDHQVLLNCYFNLYRNIFLM